MRTNLIGTLQEGDVCLFSREVTKPFYPPVVGVLGRTPSGPDLMPTYQIVGDSSAFGECHILAKREDFELDAKTAKHTDYAIATLITQYLNKVKRPASGYTNGVTIHATVRGLFNELRQPQNC